MMTVNLACTPGDGLEMCRIARKLGFAIKGTCAIKKHTRGSVQVWESTFSGTGLDLIGNFITLWTPRSCSGGSEPFKVFELNAVPLK